MKGLIKKGLMLGCLLLSACQFSPRIEAIDESVFSQPKQELINSKAHQYLYDNWQFSQAVKVGNQVWVSGQIGYDRVNKKYPESVLEQSYHAFANLEAVLKSAGATMDDVVSITTFHTDISKIGDVVKSKSKFMPKDFSAWTAVEVTGLAQPQILFEVKAVAIIGSGKDE